MNRRGYSLVELLAVIIILGLLITVTIPIINGSILKSKQKALEVQKKEIISAGRKYATKHTNLLPDDENPTKQILIQTLINEKYIEKENIINPITNENLNGCIVIRYKVGKEEYNYSYSESCNPLPIVKYNYLVINEKNASFTFNISSIEISKIKSIKVLLKDSSKNDLVQTTSTNNALNVSAKADGSYDITSIFQLDYGQDANWITKFIQTDPNVVKLKTPNYADVQITMNDGSVQEGLNNSELNINESSYLWNSRFDFVPLISISTVSTTTRTSGDNTYGALSVDLTFTNLKDHKFENLIAKSYNADNILMVTTSFKLAGNIITANPYFLTLSMAMTLSPIETSSWKSVRSIKEVTPFDPPKKLDVSMEIENGLISVSSKNITLASTDWTKIF